MLKTEILSVGTELLMGMIANTDAEYISKRLPEAGCGVYYHTVVGDNPDRLSDCLKLALSRADIVITTGGLGPTQDDLTKQTIAKCLGLGLVFDGHTAELIREYFRTRGRSCQMTQNNYRQAEIPEGAVILENHHGTAPGCIITAADGEFRGKTVIMLPGPPSELKPMFDEYVLPYYKSLHEGFLASRFVSVCGTGESKVETLLLPLIDGQTNPTYATYAKDGLVTVRVTASGATEAEAEACADKGAQAVAEIIGDDVFSFTGESPEEAVLRLLKEKGKTLALAESLTGGMISERITAVPGASAHFLCGFVTYTDAAKHNMLCVKEETLTAYTAVSAEVCAEMCKGARQNSGADIALAVTGYAGPQTGSEPVGLVYIGLSTAEGETVRECRFGGDRGRIRNLTAVNGLDMIRRVLEKL